ncbi:MAG: alpha-amylase family glycosyl hydrolase [Bdellovibrionota bacterium]
MAQSLLKGTIFLVFFSNTTLKAEVIPSAEGAHGIAQVKSWAQKRIEDAKVSFTQNRGHRSPSPSFWGGEVIYQIQIDRFNNGNPFNDSSNIPKVQQENQKGTQYKIQEYRHGGDLEGITQRLDYLKELGVGALWITPVFKNKNASYHNYCTSDFTQVDPAFGDNEDLRTLVAEAHKRDIKVILDIVVNHVCDSDTKYISSPADNYGTCVSDLMSKYFSGNPNQEIRGQKQIQFSNSFFPAFKNPAFLSRCGNLAGDSGSNGAGAVFGDFSDEMLDFNTLNYDFQEIFTDIHKWWIAYADIDGFRMDAAKHVSADFVAKFATETRSFAKSLGKDNFYVVGEVAGEIQFYDKQINPALHVGWMQNALHSNEVPPSVKNRAIELYPQYSRNEHWPHPGLNGTYDFALSGTLVEVWRRNSSPMNFKSLFYSGKDYQNDQKTPYYDELNIQNDQGQYQIDSRLNWILLEIHDWPRFAFYGQSYQQMIGAMSQLLLSEGMPIIYYGYEQGFNGAHPGNDKIQIQDSKTYAEIQHLLGYTEHPHDGFYHPRHRQDMFASGPFKLGSTYPPINDLAGVGKETSGSSYPNWREDPFLKTDHELFHRIRSLTHLRKSCSALKYGHVFFRAANSEKEGGLMAFSRIDTVGGNEALVALNTSNHRIELAALIIDSSLAKGRQDTPWINALNNSQRGWTQESSNNENALLSFDNPDTPEIEKLNLDAGALAVFIQESELGPYSPELKTHLCLE